jgi:hypothetical protein
LAASAPPPAELPAAPHLSGCHFCPETNSHWETVKSAKKKKKQSKAEESAPYHGELAVGGAQVGVGAVAGDAEHRVEAPVLAGHRNNEPAATDRIVCGGEEEHAGLLAKAAGA